MLNYRDKKGLAKVKLVTGTVTAETIVTVSLPTLLGISADVCKNASIVNIYKTTSAAVPEVLTTLSAIAVNAAGALTITDSALATGDVFYVTLDLGFVEALDPTLS